MGVMIGGRGFWRSPVWVLFAIGGKGVWKSGRGCLRPRGCWAALGTYGFKVEQENVGETVRGTAGGRDACGGGEWGR